MFHPAEPGIPVPGNPSVDQVSQRPGNNDQDIQQGPAAIKTAGNPECCRALLIHATAFQQDHGIQTGNGVARSGQQITTDIRLKRGEPEPSPTVAPDNETHGPMAKTAVAIKEDNGGLYFHVARIPEGAPVLKDIDAQ